MIYSGTTDFQPVNHRGSAGFQPVSAKEKNEIPPHESFNQKPPLDDKEPISDSLKGLIQPITHVHQSSTNTAKRTAIQALAYDLVSLLRHLRPSQSDQRRDSVRWSLPEVRRDHPGHDRSARDLLAVFRGALKRATGFQLDVRISRSRTHSETRYASTGQAGLSFDSDLYDRLEVVVSSGAECVGSA